MLSFVDYPGLLIMGVLVLCLVIGTLLNAFFNGFEREENAAEHDAGIEPRLVPDEDCVHVKTGTADCADCADKEEARQV